MDQLKTYEELVAENNLLRVRVKAKLDEDLIAAQPKIDARQNYEKYDEAE